MLLKVWKRKALYLLGKTRQAQQQYDEAKAHYEQALALIADDVSYTKEVEELRDLLQQVSMVCDQDMVESANSNTLFALDFQVLF